MTTETDNKDRLAELKAAAKVFLDDNQAIAGKAEMVEIDGPDGEKVKAPRITSEMKTRFDSNQEQLRLIKADVDSLEELKALQEWADAPGSPSVALAAAAAAARNGGSVPDDWREIRKTLGQRVMGSEEWQGLKSSSGIKRSMTYDVASFKDVYSDLPTGTPGTFGRVQRDPLVPMAQRTARVRDLFSAVNTDAALIEFFRITGFNNQASMVPERDGSAFALKPHSNLSVEGQQAAVRTIAHWEVAHRNVLDDEPQLRGIIDNELLYGLALTEDYQILQGTGTGQDLLGILNTPGVQTYTQGGTEAKGRFRSKLRSSLMARSRPRAK